MRPPPLPGQIHLLQNVLGTIAEMQETGERPVVVFDLDGTLFDARPRTQAICLEYAEEVANDFPDVAERLRPLQATDVHSLLSATLRDCGLTHPDVVRDITQFWHDRYFGDEYLQHDLPSAGAAAFVQACHESGATVLYLSGRDIPGMLLGTVAALRDNGFPVGSSGVELVLKPDATMPDESFKRAIIPMLSRVGTVIAAFDNEPANCNAILDSYADAYVALLETLQVPGAPLPREQVHHIIDFRLH